MHFEYIFEQGRGSDLINTDSVSDMNHERNWMSEGIKNERFHIKLKKKTN